MSTTGTASKLQRVETWPSVLSCFVAQRTHVPFAWGAQDCCLFAADGVAAITGTDLAADLRGYSTALGAARRARAAGAGPDDPFGVHLWPERAGLPEIPPALAGRGDIVLVSTDPDGARRGLCLGLCLGLDAAAPGAERLEFYRRAAWRRAWRVG
jgi:hypothetical protein